MLGGASVNKGNRRTNAAACYHVDAAFLTAATKHVTFSIDITTPTPYTPSTPFTAFSEEDIFEAF